MKLTAILLIGLGTAVFENARVLADSAMKEVPGVCETCVNDPSVNIETNASDCGPRSIERMITSDEFEGNSFEIKESGNRFHASVLRLTKMPVEPSSKFNFLSAALGDNHDVFAVDESGKMMSRGGIVLDDGASMLVKEGSINVVSDSGGVRLKGRANGRRQEALLHLHLDRDGSKDATKSRKLLEIETSDGVGSASRAISIRRNDREVFGISVDGRVRMYNAQVEENATIKRLRLTDRAEALNSLYVERRITQSDAKGTPKSVLRVHLPAKQGRCDGAVLNVTADSCANDDFVLLGASSDGGSTSVFDVHGSGETTVHRGGLRVTSGGMRVVSGGLGVESGGLHVEAGGVRVDDGGIVSSSTAGLGLDVRGGASVRNEGQNAPAIVMDASSRDFINTVALIKGSSDTPSAYRMIDAKHFDETVFSVRGDGQVEVGCQVGASDTDSGALTVKGGVGVGKDLHVGGSLHAKAFVSTADSMKLIAEGVGGIVLDAGVEGHGVVRVTRGKVESSDDTPLELRGRSDFFARAEGGNLRLVASDHASIVAKTGDVAIESSNDVSIRGVSDIVLSTTTGDVRLATTGIGKGVHVDADLFVSHDLRVTDKISGASFTDGVATLKNGALLATSVHDRTGSGLHNGAFAALSLSDGSGTSIADGRIHALFFSDGVATLQNGTLSSLRSIQASEFSDGIASIRNGTARMASARVSSNVTVGGTISASNISDGFAVMCEGRLEGLRNVRSEGFSDGIASLTNGSLLASAIELRGALSSTGTVEARALTDGVLMMSGGNLSNVDAIFMRSLTDGVATLSNGVLKASSVIVEGGVTGVNVSAKTFTDGFATLTDGRAEGLESVRTNKFSDGFARLEEGRFEGLRSVETDELKIGSEGVRIDSRSLRADSDFEISLKKGSSLLLRSNLVLGRDVRIRDASGLHKWPDYVFEADYALMPLGDLKRFVGRNKHLPGIPSLEKISQDGMDHSEMIRVLLEKVEELTLHAIDLSSRLEALESKLPS
eukprot:g1273.t1